jgi:GH25 family lysozyme M1 (1,4-beta-N-acetylmuramidase)
MLSRRWLSSGVAAVLMSGLMVAVSTPARAADVVPDGGGWAHAGALPGASAGASRAGTVGAQVATPPGYSVAGVDVSSHDHTYYAIDWPGVAASGVSFAYIKATEGQFYTNPYFAADNQASKAAGLLTGAYTFGRPDLRDPVGDANYFINNAAWTNDSHTLVPFLDMEWPYIAGTPTCYGLSVQEMVTWIQQFLDQVKLRIGRNAMIYTAASWWNQCTGNTTAFSGYPLDVASFSSSAPTTLPSGWQSWNVWQYAAGNSGQQGNYDKDVFNGTQDDLRLLAGVDPPPPLTSKPAAFNHASLNQTEVYANAGGSLVERIWRPGSGWQAGWSGWSNFGGNLTGAPVVFYNPRSATVEVYANSNGHLVQKYWSNGAWSGWSDLGGNLAGDPYVFYNPSYGGTEVYVRTTANTIAYKYYAGGWSGWNDIGGSIAGDPTVIYNPHYGSTEIYVRSSANSVTYKYYAGGWSGWNDLGGGATGDPVMFYNPNYGTTEVYVNAGGSIAERYYAPGSGWSGWNDLGGTVTGNPSLYYNATYKSTEIYANTGGSLEERYYSVGGGWGGWTNLGGALTSDPVAYRNPANGNTEIYANSSGSLVQKYWSISQVQWSAWLNLMQ